MLTLELAGNTTKINVTSLIVNILLGRQSLQNHLNLNLTMTKRKKFNMEKCVTKEVKSYIDNNLNPAKVNMIDPTEGSFTEPLSIKEI